MPIARERAGLLEAAVEIYDQGKGLPADVALTRLELAESLLASGGGRTRALDQAHRAHDLLPEDDPVRA